MKQKHISINGRTLTVKQKHPSYANTTQVCNQSVNWKIFSIQSTAIAFLNLTCLSLLDFLGFHSPDNLVLESAVTLDIRAPSMTLSTCQALCRATTETSTVAIVQPAGVYYCTPGDADCNLHTRCICGKGKK